jgi:hypothetical protein
VIFSIDTCILLDILLPDPQFGESSKNLLKEASIKGHLLICDLVYAELSPQFSTKRDLDEFLNDTGIRVKHLSLDVLWKAGKVWKDYLKEGGKRETRILPDFIIGAFSKLSANALISRDKEFYKKYFDIKIYE